MKKEKKEFLKLRKNVIKYNKFLIAVFGLFILYALIYSISILDCSGVDFYNLVCNGDCTKEMFTCTNVSSGLLAFFLNHHMTICIIFLIAALVFLVLQKVNLYKINKLEVDELREEKVNKSGHIVLTLLLGYTGIHKYRTENKAIGRFYLVNFILFIITWIIKNFFTSTYNDYTIFYCTYELSVLFLTGIIILNIVEAIFSLASLKDDEEKIFA